MNRFFILAGLVLLLGLSGCGQTTGDNEISQPPESSSSSTEVSVDVLPAMYNLAEVAEHAVKTDCWIVIGEKVYDVTDIESHPGQDAIFEGCGIDATLLFETRPMGSGTSHSEQARNWMEDFYIGDLES